MSGPTDPETSPMVLEDRICTGCGCLCDDIVLTIEENRITDARHACDRGRAWLLQTCDGLGPSCRVDGRAASIEEGLQRAAHLLSSARSPLVFGRGDATVDTLRSAASLAARVGACIDFETRDTGSVEALQSIGQVTCTLGEIRNRADVVLVWRADPLESHPRLFSRYVLDPVGAFIPEGRAGRHVVFIDDHENRSAQQAADQFIRIDKDREAGAIWTLRALARGIDLNPGDVESSSGVGLETWRGLMERMRAAKYGVLFYGIGPTGPYSSGRIAALHALVREMNALTRFVCMSLPGDGGNPVAARNVLTWRTGYPVAVDLTRGFACYGPGESGGRDVLRRRAADAVLIVSGDPSVGLDAEARAYLMGIPAVSVGSEETVGGIEPAVFIRTGIHGIHTTGTVYRMDGVPLPLRAALPSSFPTAEVILRGIESRLPAVGDPAAGTGNVDPARSPCL